MVLMATITLLLVVNVPGVLARDIGWSMAQCTGSVLSGEDRDADGLLDRCEFAIASNFEPVLYFYDLEASQARIPFWAVKKTGATEVQVFYALSYLRDGGDPQLNRAYSHDGDSEFIVVRIRNTAGSEWVIEEIYLSAHYGAPTDSSAWHSYTLLSYYQNYRATPVVHVAEEKHGNYASRAACDAGAAFQDRCNQVVRAEWLGVLDGRNLGNLTVPLWDGVFADGDGDQQTELETYSRPLRFCGWRVDAQDNPGRSSCAPEVNTHLNELGAFGFADCSGTSSERYLSSGRQMVEPNGTYYYVPNAGRHGARLVGPAFSDFDLYLFKWVDSWQLVASAASSSTIERIAYDGTAGYYVWLVHAYSGYGVYSICVARPRP